MEPVELYHPGVILPLTSHHPPEPFGKPDYKNPTTPGVRKLTPDDVGHLSYDEITFARHPRERHEPSLLPLPQWYPDNQTTHLKIELPLSTTSSGPGAQVVLCSVVDTAADVWKKMGHERPKLIVAKIFDPLYYYDAPDMVEAADREYAQEAAAYIRLHTQRFDKKETYTAKPDLVPGFFGTWTTDITRAHLRKPFMASKNKKNTRKKEAQDRKAFDDASKAAASTNASGTTRPTKLSPHPFRPVRIVLLEYIEGTRLSDLCNETLDDMGNDVLQPVQQYSDEVKRLKIFHSIMDTGARVGHFGITHFKRRPSSFIVKSADDRVVMTDFSQSDVWEYTDVGFHIQQTLPRPLHPMTLCDIDKWHLFCGWFPPEWLKDVSLYDTWGEGAFNHELYTSAEKFDEYSENIGWVKRLKSFGRLSSLPGEPTYKPMEGLCNDFDEEFEKRLKAIAIERGLERELETPRTSAPAPDLDAGLPVTPRLVALPDSAPNTRGPRPDSDHRKSDGTPGSQSSSLALRTGRA